MASGGIGEIADTAPEIENATARRRQEPMVPQTGDELIHELARRVFVDGGRPDVRRIVPLAIGLFELGVRRLRMNEQHAARRACEKREATPLLPGPVD
jgi:hypothetical protein